MKIIDFKGDAAKRDPDLRHSLFPQTDKGLKLCFAPGELRPYRPLVLRAGIRYRALKALSIVSGDAATPRRGQAARKKFKAQGLPGRFRRPNHPLSLRHCQLRETCVR
jgi:hypothetical protein